MGREQAKRFQAPAMATCLAALLAACGGPPVPKAPETLDLSGEAIVTPDGKAPAGPEGACWARDVAPLVIETVTETLQVAPEEKAPDGSVLRPAAFRSETRQRIVQERSEIWFRAPCPDSVTVSFVASLQRALKARGFYLAPVTGDFDATTAEALRRYQAKHGLDSAQLSLAAARDLGLVAVEF